MPLSRGIHSTLGLVLLGWGRLENVVVSVCWWKDDYLSLKPTVVAKKRDHPKVYSNIGLGKAS